MTDPVTPTWTVIGEIQPSSEWLLTAPTTANAFKFEHHNPPRRVLLHIAQTDGLAWLFEPRTLSSDRDAQVLILEDNPVFAGERRISIRYADPTSVVSNWTVKVSAATVNLPTVGMTAQLAQLETQQEVIMTQLATIATQQGQILTQIAALASGIDQPDAGGPNSPVPLNIPYVASTSSVYQNVVQLQPSYQKLQDRRGDTGIGTEDIGPQCLQATFPVPVIVQAVTVGGGMIPEWGPVATYLNGAAIQYSVNGSDWVTVTTVAGVSSDNEDDGSVTATSRVASSFLEWSPTDASS